jgi:hypothetical protein
MKKLILILLLLLLASLVLRGKVVTLSDLVKPRHIAVDEHQIYIIEGTTVFIYSLNDFKLKKKFGKEGEGPQEFKRRIIQVNIQPDCIFLNSAGKVSYFKKDGKFIKERRAISPDMRLTPFGNEFVGGRSLAENNTLYFFIGIYDTNLKKIKDVYKQERAVQMGGKGTKVFAHPLPYYTDEDNLFIVKGKDLVIDVLDKAGEKRYSITYDYKRINVTADDKKRVLDHLKTDPETKPYLEMIKPIIFPGYFPAIRNYYIADKKIYVLTYKQKNDKTECFIFDMKGTFLKQVFLPYVYVNPVDEYPAAIKNGRLYQLIENEGTEEWELHITGIK